VKIGRKRNVDGDVLAPVTGNRGRDKKDFGGTTLNENTDRASGLVLLRQ
jgi:hypothetical protein